MPKEKRRRKKMEYQGRRGRRGRGRPYANATFPNHLFTPPQSNKPWSIVSSFYSFVILTSLIVLIYLMLDYHCSTCNAKCNLNNITRNLEDITKNLSAIKDSYYNLELKISTFSKDLPKIEGQIDVLEALANTMESKNFGWDPKNHLTLPNVDVFLNKPVQGQNRNVSKKSSRHITRKIPFNYD